MVLRSIATRCVRSSELSSIGHNKVKKWRSNLNSDQSVDLHDSESSLTNTIFNNDSTLDQLVGPNDSASQITEVISESSIQNRVYDMNNVKDILDLMNDPYVTFSNFPLDNGDDLITFHTADSSNEILRSVLENLLNSVN